MKTAFTVTALCAVASAMPSWMEMLVFKTELGLDRPLSSAGVAAAAKDELPMPKQYHASSIFQINNAIPALYTEEWIDMSAQKGRINVLSQKFNATMFYSDNKLYSFSQKNSDGDVDCVIYEGGSSAPQKSYKFERTQFHAGKLVDSYKHSENNGEVTDRYFVDVSTNNWVAKEFTSRNGGNNFKSSTLYFQFSTDKIEKSVFNIPTNVECKPQQLLTADIPEAMKEYVKSFRF
ncbi:hypothetical protein MIR68_005809 [Amoeboaphelidium protococcarum]|nr:hypothetical protein MIR68_005809 [Amoeboaphelidium protococcarum]KAI3646615.1 hypothetical protein MP228_009543 [Amoeboaphelidium protococcarum]